MSIRLYRGRGRKYCRWGKNHLERVGSAVVVMLSVFSTGCSILGPHVTATSDAVHYRLPAASADQRTAAARRQRPAQLVNVSGGRYVPAGDWRLGQDGLFHASLAGRDLMSCYAVRNASGEFLPVRVGGSDPYTFRLPKHAEVVTRGQELQQVESDRKQLLSRARSERDRFSSANRWLANSVYYSNGECLQPPPRTAPSRPQAACEPSESRSHGERVCWGSFSVGYSCDKARALMGATKSGLSNLAASVGCSALAAEAQGEQLTVGSWLADTLIDGPTMNCLESMSNGNIGGALCSVIFVPLFAAKMDVCITNKANECAQRYQSWAQAVNDAETFPARTVATCHENLQIQANGTAHAEQLERDSTQYDSRIAKARSRYNDAQQNIGETDLADFPCGG